MTDDVIPLNKIGKIGTVKVYNQAYVDKQQKRIEELEVTNKKISDECHKLVDSLEKEQKENAELKKENQKWKDGIALKDEEIGCIETDFNTFKSKAKEIIKNLVEFDSSYKDDEEYQCKSELYDKIWEEAEQFLKEE